jgi:hypothetical protein
VVVTNLIFLSIPTTKERRTAAASLDSPQPPALNPAVRTMMNQPQGLSEVEHPSRGNEFVRVSEGEEFASFIAAGGHGHVFRVTAALAYRGV